MSRPITIELLIKATPSVVLAVIKRHANQREQLLSVCLSLPLSLLMLLMLMLLVLDFPSLHFSLTLVKMAAASAGTGLPVIFLNSAPGSFFVLRFYIFLLPSRLLTTHKGPYERNYSD